MSDVARVCHIDDLDDLCLEGILANICEGSATMANARATCRRWRATIERIRAQKLREIRRTFGYLRANAQERLMFAIIRARPAALREHLRTCGLNATTIGEIAYVNLAYIFMPSPVSCANIEDSRANIGDPMILQVLREEIALNLSHEHEENTDHSLDEWDEGIFHTLYLHATAIWPGINFAQLMPDTTNRGTIISCDRMREMFEECANICAQIARRDDGAFSHVMAIIEATLAWNRNNTFSKIYREGRTVHCATCVSRYNYMIPAILIACARYMSYKQVCAIWPLFRKYESTPFNMASLELDTYIGMIITSRETMDGFLHIYHSHDKSAVILLYFNEVRHHLRNIVDTEWSSFAHDRALFIARIIRHFRMRLSAFCEYIVPWYDLEWAHFYDQLFIEIALHARIIARVPPMIDDETVIAKSREWAHQYWYDTVYVKDGAIEPIDEIDRDISRMETFARIDCANRFSAQHVHAPSGERNFHIFRLILRLKSVE